MKFGPGEPLYPSPIAPILPTGRPEPKRWQYPVGGTALSSTEMVVLYSRIAFDPRHAFGVELDPIPWPEGLAPQYEPIEGVRSTDPLPLADVLIVTYTQAEGQALADVLTPGYPSSSWNPYLYGWGDIRPLVGPDGPSLHSDRAGSWAVTAIGDLRVVLFKSELHPATDGPKLPMVTLWQQIIGQVKPRLVITTGTAGGVGADTALGDVVATYTVRWDAKTRFKAEPWCDTKYSSAAGAAVLTSPGVEAALQVAAETLLPVNAAKIPGATGPRVFTDATTVTTDFFAFDDASDHYGLRAFEPTARAVEMDDAALPLALGASPQAWLSVRNASDPQMNGPDVHTEDQQAADIYRRYGYFTTACSVITCWAIVAGLQSKS